MNGELADRPDTTPQASTHVASSLSAAQALPVLLKCFAEALDLDQRISEHDSFVELGGDSLRAVRLAALVERRLHVAVPPLLILKHPTVRELADAISAEPGRQSTTGLVTFRSAGNRIPWFLVSERANPVHLTALAKALDDDQPVHAVQSEVMWRQQLRHRSIPAAAAEHKQRIVEAWPNGPYALFGNCSDGATAYEIGRQLAADGHKVTAVVIADAPRPRADRWLRTRMLGWTKYLHEPFGTFHRRRGPFLSAARSLARGLRRPSKARAIAAEHYHQAKALRLLATGGKVPDHRALAYARYLYGHRFRTYDPEPAPDLPLLLLTSRDHGEALRDAWTNLVAQVDTAAVPCSHNELAALQEPAAGQVARLLNTELDRRLTSH